MRKLVYATSLSLDGYIDDEAGDPSWVVPGATVKCCGSAPHDQAAFPFRSLPLISLS